MKPKQRIKLVSLISSSSLQATTTNARGRESEVIPNLLRIPGISVFVAVSRKHSVVTDTSVFGEEHASFWLNSATKESTLAERERGLKNEEKFLTRLHCL